MITKIIRSILKLDENDRDISRIQSKAMDEIEQATVMLKKSGRMREMVIKKTTTFYIAQALGVIK